jgi:hypothetical protein
VTSPEGGGKIEMQEGGNGTGACPTAQFNGGGPVGVTSRPRKELPTPVCPTWLGGVITPGDAVCPPLKDLAYTCLEGPDMPATRCDGSPR